MPFFPTPLRHHTLTPNDKLTHCSRKHHCHPITLVLKSHMDRYRLALLPLTPATTGHRHVLVEASVLKHPKLNVLVSSARVGSPRLAKETVLRRSTGSVKVVKGKTSAGEYRSKPRLRLHTLMDKFSRPFVLLTGTVIVLILVVFGSVSLLYTIGDQALPSVLMGGVVNKKD